MSTQARAPVESARTGDRDKKAGSKPPGHVPGGGSRALFQAGNMAIQRSVAGTPGGQDDQQWIAVQGKLRISTPQDSYEREADEIADRVMTMPGARLGDEISLGETPRVQRKCAACEEQEAHPAEAGLQKKENGKKENGKKEGGRRDAPGITASDLNRLNGGGRALPGEQRQFFESRMQGDFSAVRIHTDNHAGSLAQSINARAFTHGSQIAFAPGQYSPGSSDGQRLLAHELVHTLQQTGTGEIYRDGEGESTTAEADTEPEATSSSSEWSFDPYAENVLELTNFDLINAILDNGDWLAENDSSQPDHGAHKIREGLLEDERARRVGIGHVWLETVADRKSYPLFQLITGANGAIDVVSVQNDELINGLPQECTATPIMTEDQFYGSIGSQGLPTMSLSEYQAQMADLLGVEAEDDELARTWGMSGGVANSSLRNYLLAEAFANHNLSSRSGGIAEAYALTGSEALYGFGILDRNRMAWQHPDRGTMSGNYPLSDLHSFLGSYPAEGSVKMRLADSAGSASPSAIANYSTYLQGYAQMLNMDPNYAGFGHFANNAGSGRSPADIRSDFGLIIPADDVDAFRNLLSDPNARDMTAGGNQSETPNYQRAEIKTIYDGLLRDTPINPGDGGPAITSIQQLDAALESGRIGIMQHDMYLRQTGAEAGSRVYANTDFNMGTHRVFESAWQDIHQSLRPQAPPGRPILHTSTRDRTSGIANSRSATERYSNYLDRLGEVIPEGTGALHVDVDDATPLQDLLRNPLGRDTTPTGRRSSQQNFQRSQLNGIYNAILQRNSVTAADGTSYSTVEAIHAAYEAGTLTAREYARLMQRVGRLAANQVQPRTTAVVDAHELAMENYRSSQNRYRQELNATRKEISSRLSPEYMGSLAHGGGLRGDFHVARSYGGRGALFGAGLGMLQEGYGMYTDDRYNPDAMERLLYAGGREGLRSGTTATLETLAASQASRYTLRQGLAMSSSRALALRMGSRFVPGGFVDAAFETGSMLTDDRANSSEEVSYRLSRAFVIGGSSALAGAYAGAAAGTALGTVVPGVGNVVGFVVGLVVGALVGAIASSLIPSYEELVQEQVPLKEFENNIQAQSPGSLQNQILAQQEYDLMSQLVHGPETRGPYNMADIYQMRNLSTSPGQRVWAEALIGDKIHGGCMDCHTQKAIPDIDAQFPWWDEARMAPIDRMSLAAIAEFNNTAPRPQFMGYNMPETTVEPWMQRDIANVGTASEMATYINMIHPNIGAWRNVLGGNANTVIPQGLMNRPMDERQLVEYMQSQIDAEQVEFESHFGEVDTDEYELYRSWLEQSQQ